MAEFLYLHFFPYSESFPDTEESTFLAVILEMREGFMPLPRVVLLWDTKE